MTQRFDLHAHTTYSDGSMTPKELIELAKSQNISGISITDHDTFQGFLEVQHEGLPIIPGVELSTDFQGHSIHILGYSFDPQDAHFYDFCLKQRVRRKQRNREMLQKLGALGMIIEEHELVTSQDPNLTFGRVHIAMLLVKKGYVKEPIDAFKLYIGNGKSCYVSGEKWTTLEAIDAIHKAKGKAVLAHPHIIKSKSLVKKLLELPFDGIEAYYSRFHSYEHEQWLRIASEHNLFVTGGSDFHGLVKPDVSLGVSFAPDATFELLKKHFDDISRMP